MTDDSVTTPAADELSAANVSIAANAVESVNPWASSDSHLAVDLPLLAPQATSLNPEVETPAPLSGLIPPRDSEERTTHSSVLNEFDPLASDPVQQHARDAWAATEGRPPPSIAQSTSSPSAGSPDEDNVVQSVEAPKTSPPLTQSAPATSSTFPSLASLARTLNLGTRRSVTPPLPPPPRSSSLRHASHASVSAIPTSPGPPVTTPTVVVNDVPQRSTPPMTFKSEGVTIVSSPRPDGQFDFQKFLDQMKTKSADPIAKYLRSFLSNFAKKTFTVSDQIKIIHDFLDFIADKMRTMDGSPWQNASPQEFDNAMEAMEKLVMNRLYEFTFQPLLPPSLRTTDDLERDHVLRQRIGLFGWLKEEHLDVPTAGDAGQGGKEIKGFLEFAQQELLKINHYKAPRDKLICILNCCKVIFGLIRHVRMTEGADSFIPILIFVVLKANPENLLSNIEYINRFRNPSKLKSEAGYYLSSLMGAVSFIETMDHSSLSSISQEEFERNVEDAIQALPITRTPSPSAPSQSAPSTPAPQTPRNQAPLPALPTQSPLAGEEAARPLSLKIPPSAGAADPNSTPLSIADDTKRFFQRTSNTISKPLAAIGRIFSDVLDGPDSGAPSDPQRKVGWRDLPGPFAPLNTGSGNQQSPNSGETRQAPQTPLGDGSYQPPIQTPYKPRIRPTYSNSPGSTLTNSPAGSDRGSLMANQQLALNPHAGAQSPTYVQQSFQTGSSPHPSRNPTPTLDLGALQEEIDRAHLAAHDAARETLTQIFPTVEREVAEMVLEANNGDLGRSIEALLEISGGQPG